MKQTRLYETWCGMKKRCYNPKSREYKSYGKRGIKVCEEWKNDFMAFYRWAVSSGYSDDLTIDRIDVNGDYSPSNCKWSTLLEQQRNKTTTLFIEHDGQKKTLAEWCEVLGVSYTCARSRCTRAEKEHGAATYDDIFSLPQNYRNRRIAQYTKEGELVRYWDGATAAERDGGFSRGSIQQCLSGKVKVSGGYVWRYAEA